MQPNYPVEAPACPYCCSRHVDAEFIDIGVGYEQVTPWHCVSCDAREFYDTEEYDGATPEEQSTGWLRGDL